MHAERAEFFAGRSNALQNISKNVGPFLSLGFLLLQMTTHVSILRLSRSHTGSLYSSSTVVLLSEIMKLVFCLLYLPYSTSLPLASLLNDHIYNNPKILLQLSIPSLLYYIQNNLLIAALSHLPVGTYQALYQLKILTTAVFSFVFLARRYTNKQYAALITLTFGAALCQLSGSEEGNINGSTQDKMTGVICVVVASMTSGFAGVYFEMKLKQAKASLWVRNLQLAVPSTIFAIFGCMGDPSIRANGFFSGYSFVVLLVILLQSGGGFLVAIVVSSHSNVAKVITGSLSVITSSAVGYVFFDFKPDLMFALGAAAVVMSAAAYAKNQASPKSVLPTQAPQVLETKQDK